MNGRARLERVATFERRVGSDYAWSGGHGDDLPAGLRERVPLFLGEATRGQRRGILVWTSGGGAWVIRAERAGTDEQGRPTWAAPVDRVRCELPVHVFEIALAVYMAPADVELDLRLPDVREPLSPYLRAKLVFGRPLALPVRQAHAAGALIPVRYRGLFLATTPGWEWGDWLEGLAATGLESPADPLDEPLVAIGALLDDPLAAALSRIPHAEAGALLAWWVPREGPMPARSSAALDLWLRATGSIGASLERVKRAQAELPVELRDRPEVSAWAFEAQPALARLWTGAPQPCTGDLAEWRALRDGGLLDDARFTLEHHVRLALMDAGFVDGAVRLAVAAGLCEAVAGPLLRDTLPEVAAPAEAWRAAALRLGASGARLADTLQRIIAAATLGELAADVALPAIAGLARVSAPPRALVMERIARSIACGALRGRPEDAEQLLSALLPAEPIDRVDALVAWLAHEPFPCHPRSAYFVEEDWQTLLAAVDPRPILEGCLREAAEEKALERLLVEQIALRNLAPLHDVPARYRRRHAATCAALARIDGWESWAPTVSERQAYVHAAARRVGLAAEGIVFAEVPHDRT